MIDREMVIEGLEYCTDIFKKCEDGCPYYNKTDFSECNILKKDALFLLKKQEAVELKTGHWIYKKDDDMFMCSSCEKYSIRNDYPYCHWCGAKMKQEGRK